ncbi:PTS glucose transporter subunit IIA [Lactiplantibacillus songbeiensis]|uniref:PTS glucose transporter subunit IIA n=1 Tax=Lactiplantibacillus songbeiensis TaxID=2559920 RepID=A0ABW4C3H6_9LACO|nr:PTS glucose transporter subunit IIA [Lactiplantibacillus songbeiensis]
MMKLFQRKHQMQLVAPVNGLYVDLRQAGSQGASVGFAVEPMVGEVQAPIAGTVTQISNQRLTLIADHDCEVTVQLGQPDGHAETTAFNWLVAVGDSVVPTTQLAMMDVDALHVANQSALVTCLVTNRQPSDFVIEKTGIVSHGDLIENFKIKN